MKKSLLLILACAFSASLTVSAQEPLTRVDAVVVPTNPFYTNWFVSVGGGILYFDGNYANDISFGKQLAPSVDIAVGKWFTPTIGVRGGVRGLFLNTQSSFENFATRSESDGKYDQRYKSTNIHADFMLNASNWFCGYQEYQLYNCIPYIGMGLMQGYDNHSSTDLTFNVGLLNSFDISPIFDIFLDLSGAAFKNQYTPNGVTKDFYISASLGLTYKFRSRGWNSALPEVIYTGVSVADLEALQNQVALDQVLIAELQSDIEEEQSVVTSVINSEPDRVIATNLLLTFSIGSSAIDNLSMQNLEWYASAINASSDELKFEVVGYADIYTGTPTFNENLSRARAEAIYNALTKKFGVAESKLELEYKGGVKNMYYNDRALSRSVILKPVE